MVTCIESMSCFPTSPLGVFEFYNIQYGIPNAATLGIFLGIIIMGIYLHTRSITHLAVLAIYSMSMVTATWLSDAYVAAQYQMAIYAIAVGVASVIVFMVLRILRE